MAQKSSTKRLTTRELAELLKFYDLGTFKASKSLKRRRGTQRIYILSGPNKKYLLKEYTNFDYFKRKGLYLLDFLAEKHYPSTRVFDSRKRLPYVKYKGRYFAVFEFLRFPKRSTITKERAYEVGKYLGMLHSVAKDFPIDRKNRGYEHFKKMFLDSYWKRRKAPNKIKLIMDYIKENIDSLEAPQGQPISLCHVEFVRKHLLFKGRRLYRVIDWDFISRDTMFYDLGTSTIVCFSNKIKFNFSFLAELIKAYDKERKLTSWERGHIYEAVLYGAFKYAIWDIPGEAWTFKTFDLVRELMNYNKENFNKNLRRYINVE
jgi:Ser/Thr protein kinase RdoA (MazF antagonist)